MCIIIFINSVRRPRGFCLWLNKRDDSETTSRPRNFLFSSETHAHPTGDYNMSYFDVSLEFDLTFHGGNSFAAMTYCYIILNAVQNSFCYNIILSLRYIMYKLSNSPSMLNPTFIIYSNSAFWIFKFTEIS